MCGKPHFARIPKKLRFGGKGKKRPKVFGKLRRLKGQGRK